MKIVDDQGVDGNAKIEVTALEYEALMLLASVGADLIDQEYREVVKRFGEDVACRSLAIARTLLLLYVSGANK